MSAPAFEWCAVNAEVEVKSSALTPGFCTTEGQEDLDAHTAQERSWRRCLVVEHIPRLAVTLDERWVRVKMHCSEVRAKRDLVGGSSPVRTRSCPHAIYYCVQALAIPISRKLDSMFTHWHLKSRQGRRQMMYSEPGDKRQDLILDEPVPGLEGYEDDDDEEGEP